jgi:diacylglycerol kinase (ATP)
MKRKIAFIVNPNAGTRGKENIIDTLRARIPSNINFEVINWNNKHSFNEIKNLLLKNDYTDLVAVGGDGTVNEVAKVAMEKNVPLGILPHGSGNGLARSLGIPMKLEKALDVIVNGNIRSIDGGLINKKFFFCTSGVGFDAHIGFLFASLKNRGLWGYVRTTLKELFKYKASEYRLTMNGSTFTREAFLITFANAGQYGNDFYIAPEADLNDGMLHVAIFKPFMLLSSPLIFLRFIFRKAHTSRFIETFVTDKLLLRRVEKGPIHYDGEPGEAGFDLEIESIKNAILVITP